MVQQNKSYYLWKNERPETFHYGHLFCELCWLVSDLFDYHLQGHPGPCEGKRMVNKWRSMVWSHLAVDFWTTPRLIVPAPLYWQKWERAQKRETQIYVLNSWTGLSWKHRLLEWLLFVRALVREDSRMWLYREEKQDAGQASTSDLLVEALCHNSGTGFLKERHWIYDQQLGLSFACIAESTAPRQNWSIDRKETKD